MSAACIASVVVWLQHSQERQICNACAARALHQSLGHCAEHAVRSSFTPFIFMQTASCKQHVSALGWYESSLNVIVL